MIEIDFKIILAQVVTFLIAIFILWKISWKSLVEILKKRKTEIAKNLSEAEKLKLETEKLRMEYEKLIAEIDKKAQVMITNAISFGEQQEQQIILSARDEAKKILEIARRQIGQEKELVKQDLKREIVPIAISIAERVLEKTIDRNTHKQLIEKFLTEINPH
jgi:F-type H+-transporting ATPase subunit b